MNKTVKVRLISGRRSKPGGGVYKPGDTFDMKEKEAQFVLDNYPHRYELVEAKPETKKEVIK